VGGGKYGGFWWVVVGREEGGALGTSAYREEGRGEGGGAESGRRERANHGQYHSRNVLST
jgi:hypothetical protein